jgi:hypothetical protein
VGSAIAAVQEPGVHFALALALDLDDPALFKQERFPQFRRAVFRRCLSSYIPLLANYIPVFQRIMSFRRCEFIRTSIMVRANEFAPTYPSIAL